MPLPFVANGTLYEITIPDDLEKFSIVGRVVEDESTTPVTQTSAASTMHLAI